MKTCPKMPGWNDAAWDVTAGATGYATFAALLAGFALSGLLWIAASDHPRRRSTGVIGIWASILPLSVATLLYTEIGAELRCERAVVELPIPSFLLTVGAVGLFYYLGKLLEHELGGDSARVGRLFRGSVVLLGALGVVAGNITLLRSASTPDEPTWWWLAAQALVTLGATAATARWRTRAPMDHLGAVTIIAAGVMGYSAMYLIAFQGFASWTALVLSWSRVIGWSAFVWAITRISPSTMP